MTLRQSNPHRTGQGVEVWKEGPWWSENAFFSFCWKFGLGLGRRSGQCWSSPSWVTPSWADSPSALLWYNQRLSPCHHPILPLWRLCCDVLLLLMLVKLYGHWPIMARCPPHLSFCPISACKSPCVHLPSSRLVSVPTVAAAAPQLWEQSLAGLFWAFLPPSLNRGNNGETVEELAGIKCNMGQPSSGPEG